MEVWPENWTIWRCFLALTTQWRTQAIAAGQSVVSWYEGLRYSAIDTALEAEGIRGKKERRRVIRGLQAMEAAALPVLNERG